jgi:nucleoid DNA-binding protein
MIKWRKWIMSEKKMTKYDLVKAVTDRVKDKFDVSMKETNEYLVCIKDVICEELSKGREVILPGIAKFVTADVKARNARNPRTGEPVSVPAHKTVRARVLTEVKASV